MNVPRAQGALLNVSEAAARFGVSQRQIRNFVALGRDGFSRTGRGFGDGNTQGRVGAP